MPIRPFYGEKWERNDIELLKLGSYLMEIKEFEDLSKANEEFFMYKEMIGTCKSVGKAFTMISKKHRKYSNYNQTLNFCQDK